MPHYAEINPRILRWAVERSGLDLDDFKQPVADWLSGAAQPTYSKLESFAKKAMVPFGYLFLNDPPEEKLPVPDYRTRTDQGVPRPSPNLIETIFEMQHRQLWMREYLIDNGNEQLEFVGSTSFHDDPVAVAAKIRERLGLSDDWARSVGGIDDAVRHLREQVELAGVLIFINGIVGNSTKRSLEPREFQGFVLIDDYAPLVFVNGADAKAAQMFTIAHELAHVWMGKGAIFDNVMMNAADVELEKFCNSVAVEFLVPASLFEQLWSRRTEQTTFREIARNFKVSPIVVARRAKELGLISSKDFFDFYEDYMENLPVKKKPKNGGDFWRTQNVRLGRRFGRAVVTATKEGRLSYSDAYALTRLHGSTFDRYARKVANGSGE